MFQCQLSPITLQLIEEAREKRRKASIKKTDAEKLSIQLRRDEAKLRKEETHKEKLANAIKKALKAEATKQFIEAEKKRNSVKRRYLIAQKKNKNASSDRTSYSAFEHSTSVLDVGSLFPELLLPYSIAIESWNSPVDMIFD